MYFRNVAISLGVSFDFPLFLFSKVTGRSPTWRPSSFACLSVSICISYVWL
jgi:hypothetical protein